MALGARRFDMTMLIVRQAAVLAGIGLLVGLFASAILTRVISSLLFTVSATDPATFVIIPLILAAVALVASYIPARRATRVDPMVALRYE